MGLFQDHPHQFDEYVDLNRMNTLLSIQGFRRLFKEMTETYGIIKRSSDGATALQIYESSAGKIGLKKGTAFTSDGELIWVPADIPDIAIPTDDSVVRKVFIQYTTTQIETGTIAVALNGNVVGTGTEFTKVFSTNKFLEIVGSTLGNNGVYTIDQVTDDLNMHVSSPAISSAESGLAFKVQSKFSPNYSAPSGDKRPFYYDTFSLSIESNANTETDSKFCLATVASDGNAVTIVDVRTKIHKLKESYFTELSAAYTTSSIFRVGGVNGQKVLLESFYNPNSYVKPIGVRVVGVAPAIQLLRSISSSAGGIPDLISSSVGEPGANPTGEVSVSLMFGYMDITGVGGNGTFTINNSAYSANNYFATNYFTNQCIHVPRGNPKETDTFLIVSNTNTSGGVTVLTVTNMANGLPVDLTGVTITNTDPAIIHSNADAYEIEATPYLPNGNDPPTVLDETGKVVTRVTYNKKSLALPYLRTTLRLILGEMYQIKVRCDNANAISDWVVMPAGSYVAYNLTQSYDTKFLVRMPTISSVGAAISAIATPFGFRLSITGWTDSNVFDVVYVANGTPNFYDPTQERILSTTQRNIDVTTSQPKKYSIAVRPMMAGQAVAAALTTDVVSGGGGILPGDTFLIAPTWIGLATYSGTISNVAQASGITNKFVLTLASIVTPASGSQSVATMYDVVGGSIVDDNGIEFSIIGIIDANKVLVRALSGTPTPVTGPFTINTTENGRILLDSQLLTQEIEVVKVVFDCDGLINGPCTIRWYQNSVTGKTKGDTMVVSAETQYAVETDVLLTMQDGLLTLRIDAFDVTLAKNGASITGTLAVYGRPLAQKSLVA